MLVRRIGLAADQWGWGVRMTDETRSHVESLLAPLLAQLDPDDLARTIAGQLASRLATRGQLDEINHQVKRLATSVKGLDERLKEIEGTVKGSGVTPQLVGAPWIPAGKLKQITALVVALAALGVVLLALQGAGFPVAELLGRAPPAPAKSG